MKFLYPTILGLSFVWVLGGCVAAPPRYAERGEQHFAHASEHCQRVAYREADDVHGRRHAQRVANATYEECMNRRGYDVR